MLRWVILAVVVVALAAAATVVVDYGTSSLPTSWDLPARANRNGPQPKVEVEGPLTHDFGSMAVQKTGKHSWLVKNKGEGELDLWMLGSTCMCTIAKFKKQGEKVVVNPGESTEIDLEWKTNNAVGDYSKGATIGTNDPDRPEFKLGVHGVVHEPVIVVPPLTEGVLSVGTVSNDEPKTTSVALYSPERPDMRLTRITTSKPDLMVVRKKPLTADDLKHLRAAKGGYRLDIQIKPGMSLGNFRDEVIVETDHPDQQKIEITLTGSVTGPISVMPDKLRMVTVNGKEGGSQQLTMLVRGGRSTNFKVAHKPELIEVSIAANETPTLKGRYRVTVTVPPRTPAGFIDDEIILNTDHPKVSELKIPVSIVVGAG
jgi:hypothetical protein